MSDQAGRGCPYPSRAALEAALRAAEREALAALQEAS